MIPGLPAVNPCGYLAAPTCDAILYLRLAR